MNFTDDFSTRMFWNAYFNIMTNPKYLPHGPRFNDGENDVASMILDVLSSDFESGDE